MNRSILADSDSDDERADADVQPHVDGTDVDRMELSEDNRPSEQ